LPNSDGKLFKALIDELSQGNSLIIHNNTGDINGNFNCDFSTTLGDFLDSNSKYGLTPIEDDIAIAYGFRNFGGHKIEDQSIIHQRFDEILQRVFDVLFYVVEKLY